MRTGRLAATRIAAQPPRGGMDPEPEPTLLNEAQRRAVGATLREVERCVGQIETVLSGPPPGLTTRLETDWDATERESAALACGRLRRLLAGAQRALGVEAMTRSGRREICGAASLAWAAVEDTKSDALRGYGPLAPEAGAAVDEALDALAHGLVEVLRILEGRHAKRQRAGAHSTRV